MADTDTSKMSILRPIPILNLWPMPIPRYFKKADTDTDTEFMADTDTPILQKGRYLGRYRYSIYDRYLYPDTSKRPIPILIPILNLWPILIPRYFKKADTDTQFMADTRYFKKADT